MSATKKLGPGYYELPNGDTIEKVTTDYGQGDVFTEWRWVDANGVTVQQFATKRDAVAAWEACQPEDEPHWISATIDGATCSCGRKFSHWGYNKKFPTPSDTHRYVNMARGAARSHAKAANAKRGV